MSATLLTLFPNPEDLIALPPEELGGVMLELVPAVAQRDGIFTLSHLVQPLFPSDGSGYPIHRNRAVYLAAAEALSWLMSEGLVIYDPGQPGEWMVVTRRGKSLRTRADVSAFLKGRLLPREILQPTLAEKVWPQFLRGDHDVGVFQAFKEVEVSVRKAAGYAADAIGIPLMRRAFHPESGPLTDMSRIYAEREADMHLFSGAIGHAKNPGSHRDVSMTPLEASRLVAFASHLLDIVEQRAAAKSA